MQVVLAVTALPARKRHQQRRVRQVPDHQVERVGRGVRAVAAVVPHHEQRPPHEPHL